MRIRSGIRDTFDPGSEDGKMWCNTYIYAKTTKTKLGPLILARAQLTPLALVPYISGKLKCRHFSYLTLKGLCFAKSQNHFHR
jgi:hypothetical protein